MLTVDERRHRDEQETKRAMEKRNRRTALGVPPAPYNTTQFLMNDHKSEHDVVQEPVLVSSDESNLAEEEEECEVSLDRGYDQEWARVLTANLSLLNKESLIEYALRTEREKSDLEKRLHLLERELAHIAADGSISDDPGEEGRRTSMPVRAESV